jgi:hypothetical protein
LPERCATAHADQTEARAMNPTSTTGRLAFFISTSSSPLGTFGCNARDICSPVLTADANLPSYPDNVPHQELNANKDGPVKAVIVRSGQESIVVNLDIPIPEENPGTPQPDPFHSAPNQS